MLRYLIYGLTLVGLIYLALVDGLLFLFLAPLVAVGLFLWQVARTPKRIDL
jgi:hypothetical protein